MRSALLLLILFGLAASPHVRAQAVLLDPVTRAQGSPSDYVADALQTRDGFFWLATDAGVARYDGRDVVAWTVADGLPHTYANVLLERPSGAVVVGTYGGAAVIEGGRVRPLPTSRTSVSSLAQDRFGRLYVGFSSGVEVCDDADDAVDVRCRMLVLRQRSGSGGIVEGDDGALRVVLPNNRVAVLRPSAQGVAVSEEGVSLPAEASPTDGRGLGLDAFGAAGVRLFNTGNGSVLAAAPSGRAWTIPGRVRSVLRRGAETVVGTSAGEIWRVDAARGASRIAGTADTGGYSVDALVGDYEGGLWAGLFGGGLRRVEADLLVLHSRAHPDLARATLRLSRDADGTIWLTTREGLVRRGPRGDVTTGARTVLGLTTGAPGGGRYLSVGTDVAFVGANNRQAVLTESNWVSSLLVGAGDTLWMGTYGSGVRRVVGTREVEKARGAPEIVEALAPGAGGDVWALTRSEGAARYRAGRWTSVREGLPSGAVFSLLDETGGDVASRSAGALWLGTDRGLVRRIGGVQTVFDDGGRLRGQRIHALFRTHPDTLWVVADRQVHALVGDRLLSFGRLRLRPHGGVAIHAAIGVPGERRVFLGTSEGLVEVDLGARGTALPPPRIAFLGRDDGGDARTAPSDTLRLTPGERGATLAFAPLTFGSDVTAHVQVQMADGPWSEPTPERSLALAGLADGWHRLRVRAVNAEGRASEVPAEVVIFVPPPWWRTWPARLGGLLLLIGAVGASARWATARRLRTRLAALETDRRVQGERDRISRDLHDHVGAQLTGVLAGLELLGDEAPGATDLVNALRGEVRDTMGALRTTLFTLQHPPDTFDDLGRLLDRYVRDQARFRATPVLRCVVDGASAAPLDPFEALHLFRIAQEGLQNALRHADAAAVRVRLAHEPTGTVVLTIADDGAFRAPDGTGHGLATMQARADELGAALTLEGTPEGTRVEVRWAASGGGGSRIARTGEAVPTSTVVA